MTTAAIPATPARVRAVPAAAKRPGLPGALRSELTKAAEHSPFSDELKGPGLEAAGQHIPVGRDTGAVACMADEHRSPDAPGRPRRCGGVAEAQAAPGPGDLVHAARTRRARHRGRQAGRPAR